jgi:glycosyltransferase involved in cell wall biosynthesis
MRVLHLPIIICNQAWEMSHGLRKIGVTSDYMIWDDNDSGWLLPGPPEYNLNIYHRKNTSTRRIRWEVKLFLLKSLFRYDIFHYHSNYSLFDYWDLKILKFFGKKIVVSYWGCDVRLKEQNLKYKYNACKDCTISCDSKIKENKMLNFRKYADLLLAHNPELIQYVPGCKYIPQSLDTDYWKPSKPKNKTNIFKIFHPFGNSKIRGNARGTNEIFKAVERLKSEGYKIKFIYKDGLKNRELKPYYEKADVAISQLRDGDYGVTAIEAMSSGTPVICYINPKNLKYFKKLPIISANPNNIYFKLKWAIENPDMLIKIGEDSRAYAVANHDSAKIAKKIYKLYKKL